MKEKKELKMQNETDKTGSDLSNKMSEAYWDDVFCHPDPNPEFAQNRSCEVKVNKSTIEAILREINQIIIANKNLGFLDANEISDGYHTFGELYDHRYLLFFALAKSEHKHWVSCYGRGVVGYENTKNPFWVTLTHSDGSKSYDGYFLSGLYKDKAVQITYHIPLQYWDLFVEYADLLDKAPEFDGHTSADVLERLKSL